VIESNDTECTEEGEVYEYQEEEDQGQANQGKPSILDAYLILFTYIAGFSKVYQNACFYIAKHKVYPIKYRVIVTPHFL
jgi:hypothetical protein